MEIQVMKEHRLSLSDYSRDVFALPGTTIFECLARAGILVRTPCGGQGTCGKCAIISCDGAIAPSEECLKFFSDKEIAEGMRLACKTKLNSDAVVKVPKESLFDKELLYLGFDDDANLPAKDPPVDILQFSLPEPSLENQLTDLESLRNSLGDIEVGLDILRELPLFLRQNAFKGEAIVFQNEILALRAPSSTPSLYAVSIDLGTTSVVLSLFDVKSGRLVQSGGFMNPQAKFGDDVISRISAQKESRENLEEMRRCVVDSANSLIQDICNSKKISREEIYLISVAGNTVMELFLCGIPAGQLGEIPFAPPFKNSILMDASKLGFNLNPNAKIHLFPVIGGFVGGDIVAGILSSELPSQPGKVLFVDVGTNGEIVFSDNGKMLGGAAAAGPAFEGARIDCGMRAAPGAIEKILISDGDIAYNVIRNVEPLGICGTALIDITAELLRLGVLDQYGRLLDSEEAPASVPPAIRRRIRPDSSGNSLEFFICRARDGKDISVSQKDFRELQLASGAIRASILIILKSAGVSPNNLDTVLLAGAFGNFIRRKNAKTIGLIPDIPDSKILYIGNASAAGAAALVMSKSKMMEADKIAGAVEYVEVSQDPDFQDEFASSLIFPEAGVP